MRNILVERMTSAASRYGVYVRGLEKAPVRGVILRDCTFRGVADGHVIEGAVDLTLGVIVEMAPKKEERK